MAITLLSAVHLLGLALGLGAATTKTVLLLRCGTDPHFIAAYLTLRRLITRVIITGLLLLLVSGIGFFFVGFPLTGPLVVKLVLVAAFFVLGPVIDNVAEPRYVRSAPGPGESPSPVFLQAQRQYVALEITATALFYAITALWLFW
jgi:hypothetical protein